MREELLEAVSGLLEAKFSSLRKPIRKNLAQLTVAFIRVLGAIRSGNGRLSLASLYRAWPLATRPKAREKRLHRFLQNPRLDYRSMSSCLASTVLAGKQGFCPVVFDQTKSGSAQALVSGVPYSGRVLPLSCYTFSYPLSEPGLKSQNQLEHIFLLDTEAAFPEGLVPIWIGDRIYSRALLLEQSEAEGRLYLVRGRSGTIIIYQGKRLKLNQLKAPPRRAVRYQKVLYQERKKVLVDVVVYYDPDYQEPWYLLVPIRSRPILNDQAVVNLYRERMQIEQSFRDFKTHLGLRGLKLKKDITARTGRLLLAFCIAYILCLLLGESELAAEARRVFEIPRKFPRHGTARTLSALTLAMHMLSHPDWLERSLLLLVKIIMQLAANRLSVNLSPNLIESARGP